MPNLLSLLRLLGVPVFLLLIFTRHDGWALVLLMVSGFSDWLDGYLARRWDQVTRLGQVLDPVADRLYILAALGGLTVRELVPLWLVLAVISRDVLVVAALPVLRRSGTTALPVNYLGKAATFNLLYAFPLLLLGDGSGLVAFLAGTLGWAFALWGTALYWWAGGLYAVQARRVLAGPVRVRPV